MKFPFRIALFLVFVVCCLSHPHRSYKKEKRSVGFSLTCTSCTAGIYALSAALKIKFTETVALQLATVICKFAAKQPWAVCDGISRGFREEFFYVFRQIADRSASEICGILLPECATPTDPGGASWEIYLPPKPKTFKKHKKIASQPTRPLRVLQLSDLHIDFNYTTGSEANCLNPVCCRDGLDSPVVPSLPAGYWGTVSKCDIPLRTLDNMLEYINKNIEIDYIMMTGDYINHVDWQYSQDEHLSALKQIGGSVNKRFPTTPIYWAVGNHEGVPVNSFAPHTVPEKFWPSWLYSELADLSQPWISADASKTMNYRGSYAIKVMDGLRLISLNTGFCESTNFFLYINQSDPDGTMSWLVSELYQSELAGEKVHLMAHIPPGDGECLEGWSRNYYRVIQRFSSTITGQFFGHVHSDYFTIFYKDMHNINSKPIGVGYAAPSATTFADLNPGFRVYEVSLDGKYEILEIENYYANLTVANATHPPQWKLLYKAKKDLQLVDLSPRSWEGLVDRLEKDDALLQIFFEYSYRSKKKCDSDCRRALLCSMRSGHHNNTLYCPPPRQYFLNTNRLDF